MTAMINIPQYLSPKVASHPLVRAILTALGTSIITETIAGDTVVMGMTGAANAGRDSSCVTILHDNRAYAPVWAFPYNGNLIVCAFGCQGPILFSPTHGQSDVFYPADASTDPAHLMAGWSDPIYHIERYSVGRIRMNN